MTRVLAEEPTLEAVTLDRARNTISVATLGRTDVTKLTERVSAKIQAAEESKAAACQLLSGSGNCATCESPLNEQERQNITIKHEHGATTIARVTCPTAPKFWRWRDLPFPKVVQRDVEFLEDHHHEDEWKPQLVLAMLCGALGLLAAYVVPPAWRIPLFALSYLAGAGSRRRKSGSASASARLTFIF